MRITEKYVYFWGEFPSNWYPCHFVTQTEGSEKKVFFNSEQYFMYMKAITFGDVDIAEEILLKGKNPKTAKALGRKVKNYDDKVWDEKRYQVMVDANMLKYSQNEDLKRMLLNKEFDGKKFVEASPYDCVWGIGVGETEAKDDESNWRGQNLLGKALDEVREKLKS